VSEPTPAAPASESGIDRLSLVAALLLGLAAILTAVSAYNAALKDGEALEGYSTSNAALSDANYWYSQGNQVLAADTALFVEYASALQLEQIDLSNYLLEDLMRPELQEAVRWWIDDPEATTPFVEDEGNPYVIAELAEAEVEQDRSEQAFADGQEADAVGDEYELATVLLALTLFFAGIATLFARRTLSVTLLLIGFLTLAGGAAQLAIAAT
jgi:hypothetical protein